MEKKCPNDLRDIEFPRCVNLCSTVQYVRVGDCDFICPEKFKRMQEDREMEIPKLFEEVADPLVMFLFHIAIAHNSISKIEYDEHVERIRKLAKTHPIEFLEAVDTYVLSELDTDKILADELHEIASRTNPMVRHVPVTIVE